MDALRDARPQGEALGALAALTARQAEIYGYYREQLRQSGQVPTMRAVAEALGFRSLNGLMCHLKAMEKKGVISRRPRTSRGVTLLVEEPIRAARAGDGVALDCGDRVYRLSRAGAARLSAVLAELALGPAEPSLPAGGLGEAA